MAIKISGTTVIDDSRNLVNINDGLGIGIQSAGNVIGYGITQLNFAGAGNTFSVTGSAATITISGGGGGSGVSSTGVATAFIFSNPSFISTSVTLSTGNNNYGAFGPITIGSGQTVTVGLANTFTIV